MNNSFCIPVAFRAICTLTLAAGIQYSATRLSSAAQPPQPNAPTKVEIRNTGARFQLFLNDQPFYIKGAGIEFGSQEKLKQHGGNSFRTWSTHNGRETGQQVLDRALSNGLYIAMGLDVDHERRGFDYDNTNAVARQFELLKSQVLEYRNHPALLLWVVGNELNFEKRSEEHTSELQSLRHLVCRL